MNTKKCGRSPPLTTQRELNQALEAPPQGTPPLGEGGRPTPRGGPPGPGKRATHPGNPCSPPGTQRDTHSEETPGGHRAPTRPGSPVPSAEEDTRRAPSPGTQPRAPRGEPPRAGARRIKEAKPALGAHPSHDAQRGRAQQALGTPESPETPPGAKRLRRASGPYASPRPEPQGIPRRHSGKQ